MLQTLVLNSLLKCLFVPGYLRRTSGLAAWGSAISTLLSILLLRRLSILSLRRLAVLSLGRLAVLLLLRRVLPSRRWSLLALLVDCQSRFLDV